LPRKGCILVWALMFLLGGLLAWSVTRLALQRRAREASIQAGCRGQARAAARSVQTVLADMQVLVHGIRADLERGRLQPRALDARLGQALAGAPRSASRMGVLFQPFAVDPARRLYGPYAERAAGDPRRFATGRALVKHAGLSPAEQTSGKLVGRTRLTGRGRPGLAGASRGNCGRPHPPLSNSGADGMEFPSPGRPGAWSDRRPARTLGGRIGAPYGGGAESLRAVSGQSHLEHFAIRWNHALLSSSPGLTHGCPAR